eukprot:CAMPEP_0170493874 /NCGR_PEP_ID=MMETSP0208-20121228/14320_1 /TAXON_ID=197538 /ORGANISM="Strombidium inclinatum, Strain S3" /LENGTH=97 /DNA_ID=CAMNT_0010769855 /DNA_START=1016 /DNA_END=1307 /DNA_ORIENTATION=+
MSAYNLQQKKNQGEMNSRYLKYRQKNNFAAGGGFDKTTQEDIKVSERATIFNLDYDEEHELLALCGNFPHLRLVDGSIQDFVDNSFKQQGRLKVDHD